MAHVSTCKGLKSSSSEAGLQGLFQRDGATRFCGAVWDPAQPGRKFAVEFFLDGFPIGLTLADIFDASLKSGSDGCHGFSFEIDADILLESNIAEVRLANLGTPIGKPIHLHQDGPRKEAPLNRPPVQWLGGLRFAGAVEENGEASIVKAIVEGEIVAEAIPDCWQNNGLLGKEAKSLAAFNLYLPQRFADGRVHRVQFVGNSGQQLPGSPLVFAAFADGLATFVAEHAVIDSERLRGKLFDQLMPMSLPFSKYSDWHAKLPKLKPKAQAATGAVGVVLVGDGDEEVSLASLEIQTRQNWVALALPFSDDVHGFDCNALREFLTHDAVSCSFIVFARTGYKLMPDAIERFDEAFSAHSHAFIAYGDIALSDAQDRIWPIAFSAFDYERLLEQGYCCSLFAVRLESLAVAVKGKTLNLFRLFNSLTSDPVQANPLHLPGCLGTIKELNSPAASRALASATAAHLRARHIQSKVIPSRSKLFPAVKVMRQTRSTSVSIIIPVRNRLDLLRSCLKSIDPAVKRNAAEIIIVDNDSSDPDMMHFLESFQASKRRVLRAPGPFNFSKLNNFAAEAAAGDYLCLLNNDVQALDALWLNELLSRCVDADVAAVGALLIWPSGVVQHGGVVLGSNFGATHAFNDRLSTDSGYADQLLVARECSAVTAACLLTRRTDYIAVGGLDEDFFPINFNDVDYCLKLRARGKRIIFTPHARLLHLESASRGDHQSAHRKGLFARELRSLRAKWMEALLADPAYSPILSLDPVPYSALAWPVRNIEPRWRYLPVQADIPSGM